MYCKNCGKEIDDKAFVCPNCGVKVENDENEAKPVVYGQQSSAVKIKKALNIAANVCSIVLMGILLIGAFILLSSLPLLDQVVGGSEYPEYTEEALQLIKIISIILLIFCVASIIVSSLALAKGNGNKGLGFKIAVIAMIGIVAILEFIGDGIVYGILCLIPIGLEIASLCIKVKPQTIENNN